VINPLDLAGPQFLLFYIGVGVVVLALMRAFRVAAEGGPAPRIETTDPYLIAYLRGGKNEALRVATVSLIDRGLLHVDDKDALLARGGAEEIAGRPIERALLRYFAHRRAATNIFTSSDLEAPCREYEGRLARTGLVPDAAAKAARRRRIALAVVVLVGLAGAKLWVAHARGKTNVGILIVLMIMFVISVIGGTRPFRTARGDALLADLRTLFARLRERGGTVRGGGATSEAALLAAVFGLAALPADFAYAKRLYPKASTSSASSCGSSCGSSGGSSCGGGDGGGGCGGGGGGGGGD
jgi:uncharacterized protein (TIGR04222 family)